jgi:hypothetical protein
MKKGFKPKLYTRKEWQDNRSMFLKGLGVGEGLDQWQRNCVKAISKMTKEEVATAFQTSKNLLAALDKAEGKCGSSQAESKAGIGEYKKKVVEYQNLLKEANTAFTKRAAFTDGLKSLDDLHKALNADAAFKQHFLASAKKAYVDETLDAWLLWKDKKFTDMVRKYGPKNDYNIPGPENEKLLNVFVRKTTLTPEALKAANAALNDMGTQFTEMLGPGNGFVATYKKSFAAEFLVKKFPVKDFVP